MVYRALAAAVLILHFGFVLFVIFGALFVVRWPRVAWLHVPAALWGIWIEFSGRVCPLTPLENALRARGGETGYSGGFIEHYMMRAMYPSGLTREQQFVLGTLVLVLNAAAYATLFSRRRRAGA